MQQSLPFPGWPFARLRWYGPRDSSTCFFVSTPQSPVIGPTRTMISLTANPTAASGKAPGQAPARHLNMRIDGEGGWHYQGGPINRPALVRLFARWLTSDGAGQYWLDSGGERGRIDVDDVPFIISTARWAEGPTGPVLTLGTTLGDEVTLDGTTPLLIRRWANSDCPYVVVRPGLLGRLNRPTYYELAARADEEGGFWSAGDRYSLLAA